MPSSVTVWIDAFIPKEVPGYTKFITKGTNAGKTAVPLPGLARLNPLNTFKDWSAGYLTDQRTFSTDPTSSVRMRSLAVVQLSPSATVTPSHKSSGTTQVNMDSGFRRHDRFQRRRYVEMRFRNADAGPTRRIIFIPDAAISKGSGASAHPKHIDADDQGRGGRSSRVGGSRYRL
jgi:hypothetical protein